MDGGVLLIISTRYILNTCACSYLIWKRKTRNGIKYFESRGNVILSMQSVETDVSNKMSAIKLAKTNLFQQTFIIMRSMQRS